MITTSERPWSLGTRPALDGLRGVACGLVLVAHVELIPSAWGGVGVAVFFTLSGFLITSLLLRERDLRGRVSFAQFYRRRSLRLLPALLAMLLVVGAFSAAADPNLAPPQAILASMFYYSNWVEAFGPLLGGLQHTWSLAIEEQFYLVWPPVLMFVLARFGRRGLIYVTGAGAVASLLLRVALDASGAFPGRLYFGADTRADGLLVGCLVAALLAGGKEGRSSRLTATLSILVTGCLCLCSFALGTWWQFVMSPTFVSLGTAAVIYGVARGEYVGWLTSRLLRKVGARSYALYLWGEPIGVVVFAQDIPYPLKVVLSLGLTAGAAALSWRYVETPFLKLKESRPSPVREREVALEG